MPSNRGSRGVLNLSKLTPQCQSALAEDENFIKAVQDSNVTAAANQAVTAVLDMAQQHAAKSSHVPPLSRISDPAMMSFAVNVGDEVTMNAKVHEELQPERPVEAVGCVVGLTQPSLDKAPVYTIRWQEGEQTQQEFQHLSMHKRRDKPQAGSGNPAQKLQPAQLAQLNELRSLLLHFEDKLPWNCVTRSFASSRGAWRKELAHAGSLRHFLRCYKEFLQYLKIETHLPSVQLQCNSALTLDMMQRCADSQDFSGMHHVWSTHIAPDFALWQSTASGRQRPAQIHAGRAMQVMEAAQQANNIAALADVPWGLLMTQEQLTALKSTLQRELELCDKRSKELQTLVKDGQPLTDSAMQGVTYGLDGLGGCYGGAPRARHSMLDGIWDHHSDVDTANDTGSEATDLGDSWLLEGEEGGEAHAAHRAGEGPAARQPEGGDAMDTT